MSKESFKVNAATELKERTAALNTQLRFGRERQALMHAYQLRTFLQLRGAKSEDEKHQLARVEKVIAGLEKRKTSGIQRLLKTLIETAIRSLTPEDDSEQTLLDQFSSSASIPAVGENFADEDDLEAEESGELVPTRTVENQDQEPPGDDWGWGGETVSSTSGPAAPEKTMATAQADEDHWGGAGGYSYDDKF